MNLGELRAQIKYYFEDANQCDLTNAVITRAVNAARRAAETQFAFEMNKKVLQASVDARVGADWTSLPEINTPGPFYSVRSFKRAYTVSDDGLNFAEIRINYKSLLKFTPTYPVIIQPNSMVVHDRILYVMGPKIYFYPFGQSGTMTDVALDGYIWMENYPVEGGSVVTDWMLEGHYGYLFWKAIWDLNFKRKEWVPRQEGNLQLSLDNAASEFRNMVAWDAQIRSYQTSLNELL